ERETKVTKDTVPPTNNGSTKDVQPSVVQAKTLILNSEPIFAPITEPVAAPVSAPKPNQKPSIPYPSRLYDQKLRDKANDQEEKFFQIFKDLNFNISFADALIMMRKFGPTIKTLLTNKDKLLELARTPLNEHCSESHFMVKEGIVLGHKISKNGIEVDKAKVDVIAKLPHSTTVKGGVYTTRKPLTFSRLATMDPPGDIMAQTTLPRRFGTPGAIISDRGMHFCNDQYAKALKHANFDRQTAGDHHKVQLNELNELRDQAYENYLIYKEKTKRLRDSKIKDRIFHIGDRVLLFNSRLKIFLGKLKTRWYGTFMITYVFPYGTLELSLTDGPNFKVNVHRLKHYFGEDIPKMVVSNLQTFPKDQ
nr:reverse transcriptase domain-containing protein [Tanacetum cinerariifolium]